MNQVCRFVGMMLLLTVVLTATSRADDSLKPIHTVEGISEYKLANGMKVLLFPDPSKELVTVNLTIFCGSRHEGYGETGMAHLLEHMLFKGTPTHANIPKLLTDKGADFNGTTWLDRTNYYETLPAKPGNLEFALKLEADRMVNSLIRREDLASEMTVVRNEFEMNENSPESILSQRATAVAFEWHNYGKSTIGNRADIERVPVDNLRAFYRKYYRPDNAMLIVAGNFESAEALKLIQQYFGVLKGPAEPVPATYTEEPMQDGERTVVLRRVGTIPVVTMIYHISAGTHPDFAAIEVFNTAISLEPGGLLYKALVDSKKATQVGGFAMGLHDPGALEFQAKLPKDQSPEEVRDIMANVIEERFKTELTDADIERAKAKLLKRHEQSVSDSTRLAVGLSDWAAQGDWRLFFLHRDRVESMTLAKAKEAASRYLIRSNRTVGLYIPTAKPERSSKPSEDDYRLALKDYKGKAAVATGEKFDPSPENVGKRLNVMKLPGDIAAQVVNKKTRNNQVNLGINVRFGNAESLAGQTLAAEMLADMLEKGTASMTRQQLQDELDKYQIQLSCSSSVGNATFSIRAKSENIPKALEILAEVLRKPTFDAKEFDLMKESQLASLLEEKTDPQALAMRAVRRRINQYPKNDARYVPTIDEEIETLKKLTVDDIKKLATQLGSGNIQLSVTGEVEPSTLEHFAKSVLADWKPGVEYKRLERGIDQPVDGMLEKINTPDKENAIYLSAQQLKLSENDPDYPALVMANFVLGGGSLSSRIADRLRQKDGLSYGAATRFNADSKDQRAMLMIFAICNPLNLEKAHKATVEELVKFVKNGISEKELADAKTGWLNEQKVAWAEDRALVSILNDSAFNGRSMQYYTDIEARIQKLTLDEVNAAIKKWVDPNKFSTFMAGDLKKAP